MKDFLLASNWAGIAFSVPGCAAVHAMSYPLGAKYHVPHGESNYAMFTGVMNCYMSIKSDGEIAKLNRFIADILGCEPENVYAELEKLLNVILPKKRSMNTVSKKKNCRNLLSRSSKISSVS